MGRIPLGNLRGPKGPEGPPGPNTVPTQQAVADALLAPDSAAAEALEVAVAPVAATVVPPLVAAAIAADGTVAAAAADAVDTAVETAGVVRFTDPAVPAEKAAVPGVSFALIDSTGKMSDLAVGDDGHLLSHTIEFLRTKLAGTVATTPDYDIIVIAGQSNSAAGDYLEATNFRETDPALWLWSGSAIIPLPAKDINLGAEFARAYAKSVLKTGRRVLVVQTGNPSAGFTTTSINPPPEGYYYHPVGTLDRMLTADPFNRYSRMITAVTAARTAAGTGSRLAAMVWSQGESDKRLTESGYAAKLDDLISSARTEWAVPDLPVVIGSMTPEMHSDHPDIEQVARALADTPRRVLRTGFVWGPANGHRYYQTVHYSAPGQIERAGRMAREGMVEALNNQSTIEPVMPLRLGVRRVQGTAFLEWDRPMCHVETLVVQFSTDSGATWTAATFDAMHGSRASAVVSTATPVRFRITITNTIGTTMPAEIDG